MLLKDLLLVGVGGAIGSMCRYAVSVLMHPLMNSTGFPWATMGVNVAGCFAIGWLLGPVATSPQATRSILLLAATGFLGGFTTFSAFGYETISLLRSGKIMMAGTNAMGQIALGLAATWLGVMLASNRAPGTL